MMPDELSFKPSSKLGKPDGIDDKVDEKLKEIGDKIQLTNKAEKNPPEPGEMKVELKPGLYEVDLNTLLNAQLSDCPATVIPMLIDHGVRTAVDIKNVYRPEKRYLGFQYWWVIFLAIGFVCVLMLGNMVFKIF